MKNKDTMRYIYINIKRERKERKIYMYEVMERAHTTQKGEDTIFLHPSPSTINV